MNVDIYDCVSYAIVLVAILLALAWLRPHPSDYKRSVLATVAYMGLLLVFLLRAPDVSVGHWCTVLLYRGDVLVVLLGRYLLKKTWRESLLALAIYGLVAWVIDILAAVEAYGEIGAGYQAQFAVSKYLSVLFDGLIVWLFARSASCSYGRCLLLAAAASQCTFFASCVVTQVRLHVFTSVDLFMGDMSMVLVYGLMALRFFIPFACYALMLSGVFRLSWKRSLLCAFAIILPSLLCTLFFLFTDISVL